MKKFLSIVIAVVVLSSCCVAFAGEKLIEATGSYVMDSRLDETPASATNRAREEAKRIAVEKAGVYVETYSKSIDFELDSDIVQTVAARLLKIQEETNGVEVIEKNLLQFTVTIKALVNEINEADLKTMMKDKQSLEELTRKNKEIQEKYDELKAEMDKYAKEFDSANEEQKTEIKKQVARNSEKFLAVQAMEQANNFHFAKDYAQAVSAYTEAITLNPKLAEAYNNRGIAKTELGQYTSAIEDYTTAIKLKNNFADALNNRGNAYAATEQYQKAVKDLQAAVNLQDNSATIHNNLGSVYFLIKNVDAAIKEYTRALQINPSYSEAFYNRAVAHYVQGNLIQSLLDMKAAMNLNPTDAATIEFYNKISRQK